MRLLIRCHITADIVSMLSMLMLIPFGYLLLTAEEPKDIALASLFVWLHVLLDALDGPIARTMGTAGPAGSFTDMCVDHSGMLVTTCLLTAAGFIPGTNAVIYVSSYTVAVAFTIWLNVVRRPFRVVIRTKYLLYGLVTAYGLFGVNLIEPAVVGFCVIHVFFCIAGFLKLRVVLRESESG